MGHSEIHSAHEKTIGRTPTHLRGRNSDISLCYALCFPEGLIKIMLPVGSGLFVKMAFQSAKKHPKECKSARVDIDRRITATIESWKEAAI